MEEKYKSISLKKTIKSKSIENNKNQKKSNKIYSNLNLVFYILLLLFIPMASTNRSLEENEQIIVLKVTATGNQNIIWEEFSSKPTIEYTNDQDETTTITEASSLNVPDANLEIKLKWNNNLETCEKMFYQLENIKEVDLTNFDISKITNMAYMFAGCKNLEKITFGNTYKTLLVTSIKFMFNECNNLISLDLSCFDTSKVVSMENLFEGCSTIESLDLSNFNTQLVTYMSKIFRNCQSLTYVDVSSFDTSKVTSFDSFFESCESLSSINKYRCIKF